MNTRVLGWLKRAGFKGEALRTAYGIVMRESGGDPHAYNGKGNDRSYGLSQINMLGDMGPARRKQYNLSSDDDLFDPLVNSRVMYRMSKGGRDFGPWGLGPNAYRQGAGLDTIQPFLDEFDKAGIDIDSVQPSPRFRRPTPGQMGQRLSPEDLRSFDHRQMALRSLASLARGDYDPMEGLSELISARREYEARKEAPVASPARVRAPGGPAVRPTMVQPGKGFVLPLSFTGTHVTDNLGWGTETAHDFVMPAGTPVIAPLDGHIEYVHQEGAQGGDSMMLVLDNGEEYWLGHIESDLKDGSTVKPGEQLGVISPHHETPHLHLDARRLRS